MLMIIVLYILWYCFIAQCLLVSFELPEIVLGFFFFNSVSLTKPIYWEICKWKLRPHTVHACTGSVMQRMWKCTGSVMGRDVNSYRHRTVEGCEGSDAKGYELVQGQTEERNCLLWEEVFPSGAWIWGALPRPSQPPGLCCQCRTVPLSHLSGGPLFYSGANVRLLHLP